MLEQNTNYKRDKMKLLTTMFFILMTILNAQELKIKANTFDGDEIAGVSIFTGEVNVIKENDELNASKVTIYTDKKRQPTKFVAVGDVSAHIQTEKGAIYNGKAQKAIYYPNKKEYHFFKDVYLQQVDEKKEITGDVVILKTIEGKAYAKGAKSEPVIMIFKLKEEDK